MNQPPDIAELRRLLAEAKIGRTIITIRTSAEWHSFAIAAENALPGLLDEIEKLDAARALFSMSQQTVRGLQERIEKLEAALREIDDPISFMRRRAKAEGGVLNGQMAITLSQDHNFLKSIAREALAKETTK
jgi:hypothetical protein